MRLMTSEVVTREEAWYAVIFCLELYILFFFFFQAEDGIRDGTVTGVQTCALPIFDPGSRWRYSGGGYTLAQLAMTDVTGTPFPELMQELVLGPLGMRESTYEQPRSEERRVGKECRARWGPCYESQNTGTRTCCAMS